VEAFVGDGPVEGNPFAGCAAVAVYLMRMIGTCRSPGSSVNKRSPHSLSLASKPEGEPSMSTPQNGWESSHGWVWTDETSQVECGSRVSQVR
jgi:hypothetical protein